MHRTHHRITSTVAILGELAVTDGNRVLELGAPRQRAVLAALALNANQSLTTQRIIGMVWGATHPAYAANLVHKYVSGLRRALADLSPQQRVSIESGGGGYRLAARLDQVDMSLFHAHVDAARGLRERGEHERAAEMFGEALRLWRGPLLGELPGIAFDDEREFMETVRLVVLEEYATLSISVDRHNEVVGLLRETLRDHPLEENLARLLILALYKSGRTAEAIRVYQRLSTRMLGELNMPPRPELNDMYKAIRRHEPIPTTLV
ncbi:AfsR/SARP family transcriptional regulator [Nocardiopsis alborubida]|uniref:AfsR/SARP family transcriptional regulator n=1 Tax=Nocardiopsis alborubida TaxID=146802 RepID=A0A7X6MES6_9ACTN|nr:AfsR/SARP family transcriptional regulator [Nocardiopsis alborubida]NKZ00202.1 AfsR/SARP family transcriptional regulator [Nocardiopsis alborubida]